MENKKGSVLISGRDAGLYNIAADLENAEHKKAADRLAEAICAKCSKKPSVVGYSEACDTSIVISSVRKIYGKDSFRVYTEGAALRIDCAFLNMLEAAVDSFIKECLSSDDVSLSGEVYKRDISVVCYDDFGAVGDGVTDDYKALYDTHVFANACGQKVVASPEKTYYLFDSSLGTDAAKPIPVRTDVDWQGATIIIDDTDISTMPDTPYQHLARKNIFEILPDEAHASLEIHDRETLDRIVKEGLRPGTTHINLKIDGWDGPMMIIPWNSKHKVFRRMCNAQWAGENMHEVIVLDKDGRVSEETPIMFEYKYIDNIYVYRFDPDAKITFGNGTLHTKASRVNHFNKETGKYISAGIARGILVARSYTTVKNVNHVITGGFTLLERAAGMEGPGAQGFFRTVYANHVTFKDCRIPGRMCYNNQSTYNYTVLCSNKVVADGCIQPNFWVTVDPETYEIKNATDEHGNRTSDKAILGREGVRIGEKSYTLQWGVGNSNYCKNLEYINSTLTRFDAHAGLYHGKIIGCNIVDMELTGYGEFLIENTKKYCTHGTYGNGILGMRADYGYTWDGEIKIKNFECYIDPKKKTPICCHGYRNWYFGYTCAFPNISIDNMKLFDHDTYELLSSDYEGLQYMFRFYCFATKMHLLDSGVKSVFAVVDENGDGYIDEPLYDINRDGLSDESDRWDVDGNGVVGETSLRYDEAVEKLGGAIRGGIEHPTCTANLCIIKPPRHFKMINNSVGYKCEVVDTSGDGISDGGWYRDADTHDTFGGFFGGTRFVYGEGEDEYFLGTDYNDQTVTPTFNFILDYYVPRDLTLPPRVKIKKQI